MYLVKGESVSVVICVVAGKPICVIANLLPSDYHEWVIYLPDTREIVKETFIYHLFALNVRNSGD